MAKGTVRLSAAAETDFQGIIEWTIEQFGEDQALVYGETIALALESLAEQGSALIDAKRRDEIQRGLYSLHVARDGRKGRHFIMFRIVPREPNVIEVLRLLHDSMDLPRHFHTTEEP